MVPSRGAAQLLCVALAFGTVGIAPEAQALAPDAPTPQTPVGGAAVNGLVSLSWNRPAGATSFDVQIDDAADFATPLISASNTVNLRYVPTVRLPVGDLWWRVRATSGSGDSAWSTESFKHGARRSPEPIRPASGQVLEPPVDSPRFAWRPVEGATSYTLQVSPDPDFTDPALITSSTQQTTAAVMTGYQGEGSYFWRVSASLGNGYSTGWSTPRPYTVKALPPAQLTGPVDSFDAPVREVVLDWEPVPGAANYELQIGTDNDFLSVVHSRAGIVGTRYSPPDGLDNDEYYWRVRAIDASGNRASWPMTPWRFRRAWPEQPRMVHPQGDVPNDIPFFYQWDPIELASSYMVHLYDSRGIIVCKAPITVHTTLANSRCAPSSPGHYSWKVLGMDGGGSPDPTTDVVGQSPSTFYYNGRSPVTAKSNLTVDMVTGHAVSMSGTAAYASDRRDVCTATLPATCVARQTPVMSWDPTPGAVAYRLVIARDRELTNVIKEVDVTDPVWTPAASLEDSQAGSAYFWAVRPCWKNPPSESFCAPPQHAQHSFAKKTVPPRLVSPDKGSVDDPSKPPVVQDDVTLDWGSLLAAQQESEAAMESSFDLPASTEAEEYVVETSTEASFSSTIERAIVDQTTFTSSVHTYPEGPIYWRVQAVDGSGNATVWSEPRSFEKRSPVPQMTTPADGSPLTADYTFAWKPLAYAGSYDIEIYNGPTKVAGATTWKLASWAPSDPLPPTSDGYTWRVRRVDAKGRKGAWSEQRRFSIENVVPATVAPAEGVTVAPTTSYFSWEPDARASSYRFERRRSGTTSLVESLTTRSTAWAPTSTLAAGTWQWRVVTLDTKGAALGASPWRNFTVIDAPAVVTPVSVSGSGKVGTELRVSAPVFKPQASSIAYQWYRGTAPITGATGMLYTVAAADLGKSLTVRATGTLAGYKPVISSSGAVVGGTGAALVAAHPPSVVGRPVVGGDLTIDKGVWPGGPTLTYQWYRGSTAITGATGPSYRLTATDAGTSVHVVETASIAGRSPGTAKSGAVLVAKLPSTTALKLSSARATTKQRVTVSVTVSVTGIAAPGGTVTVFDGRRKLSTVRLRASSVRIRLPRLVKGRHVVKVAYSGAAQASPSTRSARLLVVRR